MKTRSGVGLDADVRRVVDSDFVKKAARLVELNPLEILCIENFENFEVTHRRYVGTTRPAV